MTRAQRDGIGESIIKYFLPDSAAQLDDIAEAARGQQSHRVRCKRKHCIGCNGAAMKDQSCPCQQHPLVGKAKNLGDGANAIDHVLTRGGGCRRRLRDVRASRLTVETKDIGESAADIYAQEIAQDRGFRSHRHFGSCCARSRNFFVNVASRSMPGSTEPAASKAALSASMLPCANLKSSTENGFPRV